MIEIVRALPLEAEAKRAVFGGGVSRDGWDSRRRWCR